MASLDFNQYRALRIQCAKQLTQEARTHHLKQAGHLLWQKTNGIIAILDIEAKLNFYCGPVLHVNMRLMPLWAVDLLREILHMPESKQQPESLLLTEECTFCGIDLWDASHPIPKYSADVLRTLIDAQTKDFADMLGCITEAEYLSVLSTDESWNGTVMRMLAALNSGDLAFAEALLDEPHDDDDDLYDTDFDACVREYIAKKRQEGTCELNS